MEFEETRKITETDIEKKYLISTNHILYQLNIELQKDLICLTASNQFNFLTYDANFSYEELSKMPFFKNYDSISEINDILKEKINEKSVSLRLDDKKLVLSVSYQIYKKVNEVHLTLSQVEIDQTFTISQLSKLVIDLVTEIRDIKRILIVKDEEISKLNHRLFPIENEFNKQQQILLEKEEELERVKLNNEKVKEHMKEHFNILSNNQSCLIKSLEEILQLKEWIVNDNSIALKFCKIYDSNIDSDTAEAFHKKCDSKGPTLSIIESEHGLRFGGYTELTWDSSGKYKANDSNSFIFSLSKLRNFKCKDQRFVIHCNSSSNVTYGNGHDICISNCFTTNSNSYSNFGISYDTTGVYETYNYLAGSSKFKVKKVEIYTIERL